LEDHKFAEHTDCPSFHQLFSLNGGINGIGDPLNICRFLHPTTTNLPEKPHWYLNVSALLVTPCKLKKISMYQK